MIAQIVGTKMNNTIWVIRDKTTGMYLKKSANSFQYGTNIKDFLTDKLGVARIFTSKAQAEVGYQHKFNDQLNIEMEVIPMIAFPQEEL